MPRLAVSLALSTTITLGFAACVDSTPHKHPPQDPPDYHGVPTDMTPPSMIDTPPRPQPAVPQK